jgi:hypothetical protein
MVLSCNDSMTPLVVGASIEQMVVKNTNAKQVRGSANRSQLSKLASAVAVLQSG